MPERVIIIGASGHGKVVADIVVAAGDMAVGFLDDDTGKTMCGSFPVLGNISVAEKYKDCAFVVAIGSNAIRKKIAERVTGLRWYTAIHPSAVISSSAVIGEGTVVMPNAVVNAEASVGRHCIINTCAVIEHENRIGDYVHISPCAALAGNVTVGEGTHIGIGACIKNNIFICPDCTIGAGSVMVKDVLETGVYAGVPGRRIK